MKTALKYGLMITLVVVLWVVVTHIVFPLPPESKANSLATILFNVAAIVAIYFGIKTRQDESADGMTFKEGLKTGLSISLVYAVSSCLFFFILFILMGPKLMVNEPMAQTYPMWQVALLAYTGLFFGSLIFGLIYSVVISFVLVKRRRRHS